MLNPLEFKHDIASRPLKWMLRHKERGQHGPPTDAEFSLLALVGFMTAGVNLAPAWTLIQSGIRGETYLHHVSYVRFNPWAKPIFHYWTPASRAERIGGKIGYEVVGFTSAYLKNPKIMKAFAKGGAKLGARVGGRLIPGVGWALLAYDVYDIAYNRSLWGFDF